MIDRTTLAELFQGEDEPKSFLAVQHFETANVAMTLNTPIDHSRDAGDHVLTAEGVSIRIPGSDSSVSAPYVETDPD